MATEADFKRIGAYARMYNPDQNIDRHQSKRTVPMEVIAPGFSKTGTLTMQKAFATLGYSNPYHWSSIYDNVQDCDMWMELIDKKFNGTGTVTKDDFDKLLGHCSAVTDMPCTLFAAELMEFYPDAKIVLVERDFDSWYRSWSAFVQNAYNPPRARIAKLDPGYMGRIAGLGRACLLNLTGGAKTREAAKARSKEMYRKHYAFVRSIAAVGRTLEFGPADGWQPLCEFLGKPVPDMPFPHENDTARNTQSFKELGKISSQNILRNAAITVTVVGVPALALFYFLRYSR